MSQTPNQCQHSEIKERFCMGCGIYYDKSLNVHGIKSHYLNREALYSHDIIDNLRQNGFDLSRNKNYSSLGQNILNTFTEINNICRQFDASFSTKILACYIFWHSIKNEQSFQVKDIFLSILVAFTYQESSILKMNNQLVKQRIINPICFSGQVLQKELIYEQMEVLQKINFKLKLVTFVDYLEFYVISGVMVSNQQKRPSDYGKVISFIDFEIQRYMQKGLFFSEPNQQYLALKILYYAREKCLGIDEIWNWHIENITQTKKEMIDKLINERKVLTRLRQESREQNVLPGTPCCKRNVSMTKNCHQRSASMLGKIRVSGRRSIIR